MSQINFGFLNDADGHQSSGQTLLQGERAEYLPSVLEAFVAFLQSAGFTYLHGEVERQGPDFLIRTSRPVASVRANSSTFVAQGIKGSVEAPKPPAFKVGDNVKLTNPEGSSRNKNCCGIIVYDDKLPSLPLLVRFPDTEPEWCNASELTLV